MNFNKSPYAEWDTPALKKHRDDLRYDANNLLDEDKRKRAASELRLVEKELAGRGGFAGLLRSIKKLFGGK